MPFSVFPSPSGGGTSAADGTNRTLVVNADTVPTELGQVQLYDGYSTDVAAFILDIETGDEMFLLVNEIASLGQAMTVFVVPTAFEQGRIALAIANSSAANGLTIVTQAVYEAAKAATGGLYADTGFLSTTGKQCDVAVYADSAGMQLQQLYSPRVPYTAASTQLVFDAPEAGQAKSTLMSSAAGALWITGPFPFSASFTDALRFITDAEAVDVTLRLETFSGGSWETKAEAEFTVNAMGYVDGTVGVTYLTEPSQYMLDGRAYVLAMPGFSVARVTCELRGVTPKLDESEAPIMPSTFVVAMNTVGLL